MEIDSHVPLKTIAAYYMDEVDKSIKDMDRVWLLMLRGLVKLNYAFAKEPMTLAVPVPDTKVVAFPTGLLNWTKIGILNAQGEISTLRINRGLTTWKDNNPDRLSDLNVPDINDTIGLLAAAPIYLNYYYNNGYYNLYGVGNGLIQYGDCNVDEENRMIILGLDFRYDEILIEGIYAPERMNGDYLAPLHLQEAMIAFAKWKTGKGTRQEFYAEATEARRSTGKKKVSLQGVNQFIREANGMKLRS